MKQQQSAVIQLDRKYNIIPIKNKPDETFRNHFLCIFSHMLLFKWKNQHMWKALWSIWYAPLDIFSIKNLYTDQSAFWFIYLLFLQHRILKAVFLPFPSLPLPPLSRFSSIFSVRRKSQIINFRLGANVGLPFLPRNL